MERLSACLLVLLFLFVVAPVPAFAVPVTIGLTEIERVADPGVDLALLGILPRLESAFPDSEGFRLLASQRVRLDEGDTESVEVEAKTWRVEYLGRSGDHHRLRIVTPRAEQVVRAKPGTAFFIAVNGHDKVVAISVGRGGKTEDEAVVERVEGAGEKESARDAVVVVPEPPACAATWVWIVGFVVVLASVGLACQFRKSR